MHRFLTAFLCLSTLAMTQNVVAGTPSAFAPLEPGWVAIAGEAAHGVGDSRAREAVGGEVPSPGTMLLLVTGLAGLSAVGSRRTQPARQPIRS